MLLLAKRRRVDLQNFYMPTSNSTDSGAVSPPVARVDGYFCQFVEGGMYAKLSQQMGCFSGRATLMAGGQPTPGFVLRRLFWTVLSLQLHFLSFLPYHDILRHHSR